MNIKNLFIIIIILSLIFVSFGCIEKQTEIRYIPSEPKTEYVNIYPTPEPIQKNNGCVGVQNINGIDKTLYVNGCIVRINGINNNIRITNIDVKTILVNGKGNFIEYPIGANPNIKENGIDNIIKTY